MKQQIIEIINEKRQSAKNHLERLMNDNTYQRDEIMMAHLRGEIDAYTDVISLLKI